MHNTTEKLPRNFTQDFLPEKRLLSSLLTFAKENGRGDKALISSLTGIPTGESSGKVEPMIHYATGMGLLLSIKKSGVWILELTDLGRCVLNEDPYLNEDVTLWILHLMFNRRYGNSEPAVGIADPWYSLFAEGQYRLHNQFTQAEFYDFLVERNGEKSYLKGLSGQVLRSHTQDGLWSSINIIATCNYNSLTSYRINSAPVNSTLFPAYSAYCYIQWDELFFETNQLDLDDFLEKTRFLSILRWDKKKLFRWLEWMSDSGAVQIDRLTGSPLIVRLQSSLSVVNNLYSELI